MYDSRYAKSGKHLLILSSNKCLAVGCSVIGG